MNIFGRKSLLEEPTRLSTADYLCRLVEEQNSLLREVLVALGQQSHTLRTRPQVNGHTKVRTDADVTRVTREDIIAERIRQQEQSAAPWRSGPASAPTSASGGVGLPPTAPNPPEVNPKLPA